MIEASKVSPTRNYCFVLLALHRIANERLITTKKKDVYEGDEIRTFLNLSLYLTHL